MKEKIKIGIKFLKKKLRISVVFLTLLFGLLILTISYSYAFYTIATEKKNVISLTAGQFSYQLSGANITNNQVTVAPGTTFELPLVITSKNPVESNYQLYYEGTLPSGLKVSYIKESGSPNGTIGNNPNQKQLTLVIENNTSSNQNITLGIQGGLVNQENILLDNRTKIDQVFSYNQTYGFTGEVQEWVVPATGYYKVTLNAASGAQISNYKPGAGGYVSGIIYLKAQEKYYFYVGGQKSSFNLVPLNDTYVYASGGGATDMRLVKGNTFWDTESLRSRILVAGGGGGAEWPGSQGGAGGRLVADTGWGTTYGPPDNWNEENAQINYNISCHGGGQTSGGSCAGYPINASGTFGLAGWYNQWKSDGVTGSAEDNGGIGGGGYYGGGSMGYAHAGGGGSSFISGYAGVNAITTSGTHTNNTLHYSGKYFIDNNILPAYNVGVGKAEVTYLGLTHNKTNTKLNGVRYIKDCINSSSNLVDTTAIWNEVQAIKDGKNLAYGKTATLSGTVDSNYPIKNITDGDLESRSRTLTTGIQCVTVDLGAVYDLDEIAVWHYWDDWRAYNDHSLSVSRDNISYTTISTNSNYAESSIGFHIDAWD